MADMRGALAAAAAPTLEERLEGMSEADILDLFVRDPSAESRDGAAFRVCTARQYWDCLNAVLNSPTFRLRMTEVPPLLATIKFKIMESTVPADMERVDRVYRRLRMRPDYQPTAVDLGLAVTENDVELFQKLAKQLDSSQWSISTFHDLIASDDMAEALLFYATLDDMLQSTMLRDAVMRKGLYVALLPGSIPQEVKDYFLAAPVQDPMARVLVQSIPIGPLPAATPPAAPADADDLYD